MSKPGGGPAFPAIEKWDEYRPDNGPGVYRTHMGPVGGMTLRDYFAAKALALLSDPAVLVALKEDATARQCEPSKLIAVFAYDIADAMLTARGE